MYRYKKVFNELMGQSVKALALGVSFGMSQAQAQVRNPTDIFYHYLFTFIMYQLSREITFYLIQSTN